MVCGTVEASAYISAVAAFAGVVLVVLLFLGRRWCYTAVFGRKCCDDILAVNPRVQVPCLTLDNAQFGKQKKLHSASVLMSYCMCKFIFISHNDIILCC